MRWLDVPRFKLVPGEREGRSRVILDELSAEVDGLVLEAVAVLDADDPVQGYLLFLTDDTPSEDTLSISLADTSLRVTDRARLGGMYATGAWRAPRIEGPGQVSFDFLDERRWWLEVLPAPEMRLAFIEPRGVHRPFGLSRRFRLSSQAH